MVKIIHHKYHAKPTQSDGIKFASKKEAKYYETLKIMQKAGIILFFLRQVPIHIGAGVRYFVDFQVFYTDGHVEFVDIKGMQTKEFILKKKLVEERYPFEIKIV